MKKLFHKTGMYVDWDQIKTLPNINTLIDIGVGPNGSPLFYKTFKNANLILIDPLIESKKFVEKNLKKRNYVFYQCCLSDKQSAVKLHVKKKISSSTLLKTLDIVGQKTYKYLNTNAYRLDDLIGQKKNLGLIGIKIDTEGYELKVLKGAVETIKKSIFVILEARHNHKSYSSQYRLEELIDFMHENSFSLSKIITAKPLIADLCFINKKL